MRLLRCFLLRSIKHLLLILIHIIILQIKHFNCPMNKIIIDLLYNLSNILYYKLILMIKIIALIALIIFI